MRKITYTTAIAVLMCPTMVHAAEKCVKYNYKNVLVCDLCENIIIDSNNPDAYPVTSENCTQDGIFCAIDAIFDSCPPTGDCTEIEVDPAPCNACDGFNTEWYSTATGYECRHINPACTGNTCTSNGTCTSDTECRCTSGYYGTTTDGQTGCIPFDVSDLENAICLYNAQTIGAHPDGALITDGMFGLISGRCPTPNDTCQCVYTRDTSGNPLTEKYSIEISNNIPKTDTLTAYGMTCTSEYYGSASTGCTKCPNGGMAYNLAIFKNESITDCFIPSGTTFTDDTGTWEYTENCYYQ